MLATDSLIFCGFSFYYDSLVGHDFQRKLLQHLVRIFRAKLIRRVYRIFREQMQMNKYFRVNDHIPAVSPLQILWCMKMQKIDQIITTKLAKNRPNMSNPPTITICDLAWNDLLKIDQLAWKSHDLNSVLLLFSSNYTLFAFRSDEFFNNCKYYSWGKYPGY